MTLPNTYLTLRAASESSFHVSGSKFLAYAFSADNREVVTQRLTELKSLHPKARHFCYAYRILDREEIAEFSSDAGEPSGSAGQPILGELRRNDLLNTALVVVRYFGGTKLGIPGLIHAYRESARVAIEHGDRIAVTRTIPLDIEMPLALEPKFYAACKQADVTITQPEYGDRFRALIIIPAENSDAVIKRVLSLTGGREGNTEDICRRLDIRLSGYFS